jgi:hypothetical protein
VRLDNTTDGDRANEVADTEIGKLTTDREGRGSEGAFKGLDTKDVVKNIASSFGKLAVKKPVVPTQPALEESDQKKNVGESTLSGNSKTPLSGLFEAKTVPAPKPENPPKNDADIKTGLPVSAVKKLASAFGFLAKPAVVPKPASKKEEPPAPAPKETPKPIEAPKEAAIVSPVKSAIIMLASMWGTKK